METNMYLLIAILAILILLFLTIFAYVVHSGLFVEINVKSCKPHFDNLDIAYKFARGPYKESSELFTEAYAIAPDLNTIGVYYDDPRKVSHDGLRYLVGVIINDGKVTASDEIRQRLTEEGYKFTTFPAVDYVVMTSFPFKGTVSVMIAIARVYPRMAEYIKEHKLCAHPFIEIYQRDQIIFMAPLAKQDEFYVVETTVQAESVSESEFTTHDERSSDEDEGITIKPIIPQQEENTSKGIAAGDRVKSADKASNSSESDSVDSTIEVLRVERTPEDAENTPIEAAPKSQTPPPPIGTKNISDKSSSSSFEELHLETS